MFKTLNSVFKNLNSEERRYLMTGLKFVLFIGFISIFVLPFIFTRPAPFNWMDLSKQGAVGDSINGIASPFIAILAALLTFLAFYIQFRANEEQKGQFKKQAFDTAIERFESRFFEMVRIHRENVNIINSRDTTSRNDLFIAMFFELKFIYNYAQNLKVELEAKGSLPEKLSNEEVFNIAYTLFYSGSNPDTANTEIKSFQFITSQKVLFENLNSNLRKIREEYRIIVSKGLNLTLSQMKEGEEFELLENANLNKCSNKPYCYSKSNDYLSLKAENLKDPKAPVFFWLLKEPFTSHISELGPYFEHLLQTVKYLDGQDEKIFLHADVTSGIQKHGFIPENQYNYFKLLRAQISTYELLLIYYHSLSILGDDWLKKEKKELLKRYKLLKKLPVQYADFYESPNIKLGDTYEGMSMFDENKLALKMKLIHDNAK